MLINLSWYGFLENIIFDLQITIPRAHPVTISSCSDYCITTDIMWKYTKKAEKRWSLKDRGLVPTKQPEPEPGDAIFAIC